MKRLLFVMLICQVLVFTAKAQNPQLDSLQNLLQKHTTQDTLRVNLLNEIANQFYQKDFDKTFQYAQEAGELANKLGFIKGKAESLGLIGLAYAIKSDYLKALDYYQKALQLRKELGDKTGILRIYRGMGAFCFRQDDYPLALEYYQKSLQLAEELGNKSEILRTLLNTGVVYSTQGDYFKALDYYQKGLQIADELGDKAGLVASFGSIGSIFADQGNYPQALEYHQKSLKLAEELGSKEFIASSLNNVANSYKELGDYPKALDYYQKGLQLREELGDKNGILIKLQNIGSIYLTLGDHTKALPYFQKALELAEEIGRKSAIGQCYKRIGSVYLKTHQYVQALTYTLKALEIAEELKLLDELKGINEQLSKIYATTNNYQKAYEHQVAFKQLSDSIFNEANIKKITGLEYQYKYEKEKQATALEQAKKDAIQAEEAEQEKIIRNAFIAGFVLVLMLAVVIMRSLVQNRKTNRILTNQKQLIENTNEELKQSNEELNSTLFLVNQQKNEIEKQKTIVEDAHQQIQQSINYASRIQNAILPLQSTFDALLPHHFIFFKPRDVVSGDFYYIREVNNKIILAAVDCTGHGVPGAFMSFIGYLSLNVLTVIMKITSTNEILNQMHQGIRRSLRQKETQNKDGMDMTIVSIDKENKILEFAGAKNPLIFVQNGELHQIKGDIFAIGGDQRDVKFTAHKIDIAQPTTFYLFSDGYQDQFGGSEGRKFMVKRFRELLFEIHEKPMQEQKTILQETLVNWMGDTKQIDDILVIGFKI